MAQLSPVLAGNLRAIARQDRAMATRLTEAVAMDHLHGEPLQYRLHRASLRLSITADEAACAVADVHGYGNVGIVHFDAHADTADIIDGNLASHGTPMRRLIESGAIPGDRFVQVGLRGYWPPADTFDWMREQGMVWHTMQEIWDRGWS